MRPTFYHGDCLAVLRTLPAHSVDAIVTDPPSGISFMGKSWDTDKGGRREWIAWLAEIFTEARRVVKPGGHTLVWALPRTAHWTATALEDAGWDVRDVLHHVFATGFPKSLSLSKAFDRQAGAERRITGRTHGARNGNGSNNAFGAFGSAADGMYDTTAPATDLAIQWDGWGTALKPAVENWILARAPLSESSVAANVARWGTGGLNIAASRVGTQSTPRRDPRNGNLVNAHMEMRPWMQRRIEQGLPLKGDFNGEQGRWPTNLLFSHSLWCTPDGCADGCPVAELDAQSGISISKVNNRGLQTSGQHGGLAGTQPRLKPGSATERGHEDAGGASRFFPVFTYDADDLPWLPFYYTPKPDRAERDKGCAALPQHTGGELTDRADGSAGLQSPRAGAGRTSGGRNTHPTVKPQSLMRWLCRLITPPDGVVLDPFGGSGSTIVAADQCGFASIYIDQDADYLTIARARFVGDAPLFHSERPA